jgi:uncharacterized protein
MTTSKHQEDLLDEALDESFPASDPPRAFEPEGPPDQGLVRHDERRDERAGHGVFFIDKDGVRVAHMTYRREGDTVTIQHTEVSEVLRGQGAGKRLLDEVVRWARTGRLRIIPRCPFARAAFVKHPELRDVLAEDVLSGL